jgi:enamine deaminase RidA (YjgF/YER057c/UK114 family)
MSADIKMINPDTMGKPLGQYSQIARVRGAGELLFIAGQLATDKDGKLVGADDFDAQCAQVYANIETALKAVGGGWKNVVQFTTYLVHSQDVPRLRAFRAREFGRYFPDGAYPPNTLLIIDRLVNESYLIEVQTVAAL